MKLVDNRKNWWKRSEFVRFYLYVWDVILEFWLCCFGKSKVSENCEMGKWWGSFCW